MQTIILYGCPVDVNIHANSRSKCDSIKPDAFLSDEHLSTQLGEMGVTARIAKNQTSLTAMYLNSDEREKTRKSSISLSVGFSSWL